MAQKTNNDLKIVDAVETTHTEAEVIADSALEANKEAFYFAMGYLARNGVKFLEGIDKEGTYPNLTAGFANDLTGRIAETTSATFTYRPSAGDKSIRDNSATIRRIKGNSIVWNQLIINGNFNSLGNWFKGNGLATAEVSNNVLTGETKDINFSNYDIRQNVTSISGHIYIVSCDMYSETFNRFRIVWSYENGEHVIFLNFANNINNWVHYETIFTTNNIAKIFRIGVDTNTSLTGTFKVRNVNLFDLTQMFGAGNEPTTVEEFRALYPNDYYEYHLGEFQDLNVRGIETVGFNQFNGTYAQVLPNNTYYLGGQYTTLGFATEIGGYIENIALPTSTEAVGQAQTDRLYTPTQVGYIYASGTNININLSHTGVRNGEYEPYKKATQSLPIAAITGVEPLRRAGTVYDEITQTEYIKRVGVRSYAEGDENNATLLTDGTNTNYPLAEPIMTPIPEVLDLNYYVEDFGTEKALLVENSAPFSADIVYQFNAVDTIRQNEANIERLTSIVNALMANPEISNLTVGSLSILTQIAPALGMSVDLGTALNRWTTIFGKTVNAINLRLINGSATNVLLGDGSSKPIADITTKLWELTDETE